eukprot:6901901-Heterocapsa_arctica.AAC.1
MSRAKGYADEEESQRRNIISRKAGRYTEDENQKSTRGEGKSDGQEQGYVDKEYKDDAKRED